MEKYNFTTEKRSALESLRQPFAVFQFINQRVVTILLSDGFCDLFGYAERDEAVRSMDQSRYKNIHPDDVARITNAEVRFAIEGEKYDVIFRTKIKGSSDYRIVHAYGEHVYEDEGVRLAHVWYSDEGIYRKGDGQQETALNQNLINTLYENSTVKANQYDYLTGLPSMTYFFELAEAGKKRIREHGGTPVLMYMDFSGMKFYNTKHGFSEGDNLLRAFAKILARLFGNERCCRIAADHFAVQAEVKGLDDQLQQLFQDCETMNGGKTLPVHIGIYVGVKGVIHTSVACDRAKLACSALSGKYETAVNYYSEELNEEAENRQYIIENIDRAIEEKWIQVYLQPIIRAVNEKVCDVEALARWNDPEKGILSPASFIPALEDAGLIYKLDLYMVDQILETIKTQQADGLYTIPHSINLSRSDFDACDIVEEIRRRVDKAGVSRDRITIEITESVVGGDYAFMKEQVERFRDLGFPVWMDDFGSGYSSLDMLQSIRFNLLKFDMSFMRRLDEGTNGRVILTELMKMAASLGLDTVCEGVETEEQVRFLQEIGCSKLQGYYYSKPIPYDQIREMNRNHALIENENPAESDYYESIGRVSLFDLGVIASEGEKAFQNVFDTLPIAILEVSEKQVRYVRSNRSYRNYIKRYFGVDITDVPIDFSDPAFDSGETFFSIVQQCCSHGNREFFDGKMPDGSIARSFARRVSVNPVTGSVAVAVAVLSVTEPDESTTYADIARALAADYYNIFVIDLDTNDYIEYSSQVGGEQLSIERHGEDFFESARRDTMTRIYEEDREAFLALFTKEKVLQDLDSQGVFTTTYRLIDTGHPMYVNMKITRMHGGNRIILGISIIDARMKQLAEEKKLRREKTSLGRIAALSSDFIVLYTVDPVTGHYIQYNPSNEFESFGLDRQGEDFFGDAVEDAPKAIAPEDLERHLRVFTKDNLMREIHEKGSFVHDYHLIIGDKTVPVRLKATLVEEDDGEKILLGVLNDENEEYRRKLEEKYEKAKDAVIVYTRIAHALARGYTDLYYVNMETDEFIEFHTDDKHGVLNEVRRGDDFFVGCERDAKLFVHPEDQEAFVRTMNLSYLTEALKGNKVVELTYRRIKEGRSFYVGMKLSRMEDDERFIVIAVSDIDELIRKRQSEKQIQEERVIYARLHAITGNFIVVYVVDPETDRYREFSATRDYEENLGQEKAGENFFDKVREVARAHNHPADLDRFLTVFTKENVMAEIERSGIFTLGYRLMMEGKPVHVQMNAATVEEKEGLRLVVGLNNIDAQVRQEEEFSKKLEQARTQANIDALTGVKNKYAFLAAEERINRYIAEHRQPPFAIVIMDVNDLKVVNDTEGHRAGDEYLQNACRVICDTFKRSPVYRVGGDEFAVIAQGSDYVRIEELLGRIRDHNAEAYHTDGIVIACGMARFNNDASVAPVYERADQKMYVNKNNLKDGRL